jgi:epoxyqueuosine reductase
LVDRLQAAGRALGFSGIGVAGIALADAEPGLLAWLEAGHHGTMHYMARHGLKRARPAELHPGTLSVVTAKMDYLPPGAPAGEAALAAEWRALAAPGTAVVSVYARGRDYHKVMRQRLAQLAAWLEAEAGPLGHRVFCDSAPLLEVELAARSGLGWRGKHTLLLAREGGSMAFLGEICTTLPLPPTTAASAHCGSCTACLDICPTQAITAPYRLDARRCLSYLSIEHDGPIPIGFRRAMGNRLYGCDDCQLACPWNRHAQPAVVADFAPRAAFHHAGVLGYWAWDEARFLSQTEGSAIRRIGFARFRRNLAVVSGNALAATRDDAFARALRGAIEAALPGASPMLAEHLRWALAPPPAPA